MNIFVTDADPCVAATVLDDVRLNKMILETAQLLSTRISRDDMHWPSLTVREQVINRVYRSTHVNHPCSKWVAASDCNYSWLVRYFFAVCTEYELRNHKKHKTTELISYFMECNKYVPRIGRMTPFVNCCSSPRTGSFKHIQDTFIAYRMYLSAKWQSDTIRVSWKNTSAPFWYSPELIQEAKSSADWSPFKGIS